MRVGTTCMCVMSCQEQMLRAVRSVSLFCSLLLDRRLTAGAALFHFRVQKKWFTISAYRRRGPEVPVHSGRTTYHQSTERRMVSIRKEKEEKKKVQVLSCSVSLHLTG